MASEKQQLGSWGENVVKDNCFCPKCKNQKTLKLLPPNFKCADVICDFCGYLAQVKTMKVKDINSLPPRILGAAWLPQKERMDAAIYFPLYLVLTADKEYAIYYLPTDFQTPDLFVPRKPLSQNAKRAGWQGFFYELSKLPRNAFIKLL